MTCVMCSRAVTSAVSKMPGVYSVHVNLVSETADVLYNPKIITTDDIGDRINLIGYEYLGIHDNNSINNEILYDNLHIKEYIFPQVELLFCYHHRDTLFLCKVTEG